MDRQREPEGVKRAGRRSAEALPKNLLSLALTLALPFNITATAVNALVDSKMERVTEETPKLIKVLMNELKLVPPWFDTGLWLAR